MCFGLEGNLLFCCIFAFQPTWATLAEASGLKLLLLSPCSFLFFSPLITFPTEQNISHKSSNFRYLSHSPNTMGENFRVTTEGLVPSSRGKSVGTGMLLYSAVMLLTSANFSFCLGPHNYTETHKVHVEVQRKNCLSLEPEVHQDSV